VYGWSEVLNVARASWADRCIDGALLHADTLPRV